MTPCALSKASFTVDYRCGKCHVSGVKLWRGVHGCKSKEGHELLCAYCLAPDVLVSAIGKAAIDPCDDAVPMSPSDQVRGWLPAVPVDDTFWGYTSVPAADVSWWRALPTYPFNTAAEEIAHLREVLAEEQRIAIEFQVRWYEEWMKPHEDPPHL